MNKKIFTTFLIMFLLSAGAGCVGKETKAEEVFAPMDERSCPLCHTEDVQELIKKGGVEKMWIVRGERVWRDKCSFCHTYVDISPRVKGKSKEEILSMVFEMEHRAEMSRVVKLKLTTDEIRAVVTYLQHRYT